MSRFDEIAVCGNPMKVYVATPEEGGLFPAVLVMFHRAGIDEFTRDRADRLAKAGFIAAVPDLFHRTPDDADPMAALDDANVTDDIEATLEHVQKMDQCDGKVAILGHCMGGRAAFLGASVVPPISAAVIFYCGNMFKPWGKGPVPFELLEGIRGPVIGFFGNDDKNPSPDDVDRIDRELTRLGKAHEFHRYDGAGHAFQNFVRPEQYRESAERDSWDRALKFLRDNMS